MSGKRKTSSTPSSTKRNSNSPYVTTNKIGNVCKYDTQLDTPTNGNTLDSWDVANMDDISRFKITQKTTSARCHIYTTGKVSVLRVKSYSTI